MPVLKTLRKKQKQILYLMIGFLGLVFGLPTAVTQLFQPSAPDAASVFGRPVPWDAWAEFGHRWGGFREFAQRLMEQEYRNLVEQTPYMEMRFGPTLPRHPAFVQDFFRRVGLSQIYGGTEDSFNLLYGTDKEVDRGEDRAILLHYALVEEARRAGFSAGAMEIQTRAGQMGRLADGVFRNQGAGPALFSNLRLDEDRRRRLAEDNILISKLLRHAIAARVLPYPEFERRAVADSEEITVRHAAILKGKFEIDVPSVKEVEAHHADPRNEEKFKAGERREIEALRPPLPAFASDVEAPKEEELKKLYEEVKDSLFTVPEPKDEPDGEEGEGEGEEEEGGRGKRERNQRRGPGTRRNRRSTGLSTR